MNRSMIASILFIIVIAIDLYQIFGLGQYTWVDYIGVILIGAALVLTLKGAFNPEKT